MKWRFLVAAGWMTGCSAQGENAAQGLRDAAHASESDLRPKGTTLADPLSEEYQAPPLPHARVLLTDAFGLKRTVEVEVAADERTRNRGLMWRKELKAGTGMLFVFQQEGQHNFYMRNTLIPLDMIFIGKDREIVGIVPMTEPKSWASRGVGRPSQYVLEVPGGWTEKTALKVGSRVTIEGLPK